MMRYGWVGAGGGFWVLLGLRAVGEAVSREARDVSHPTLDRRACPAEIRPDDTRGRWGMSKAGRAVVAILIAAAVLWLAAWLDGTVMRDIGQQAAQSFDNTGLRQHRAWTRLFPRLARGRWWRAPAWRSRVAYVLVGAFFAFMPVIFWQFDHAPPVLPGGLIVTPARSVGRLRATESWLTRHA
jgi:hypothetical protein